MPRFAVPTSIRTMYGTSAPSSVVVVARSAGCWVRSGSTANRPPVVRYMYSTRVASEQSSSTGAPPRVPAGLRYSVVSQ
jgi:hypothetical protein